MSLKNHEDVSTQWLNLLNKVGNEDPPLRIDRGKFGKGLDTYGGFLVAHMVKNLPSIQETQVRSLIWEDALEKGMATHSSILAWRICVDRGAWWAAVHGVTKSQTRLTKHTWTHMEKTGRIAIGICYRDN